MQYMQWFTVDLEDGVAKALNLKRLTLFPFVHTTEDGNLRNTYIELLLHYYGMYYVCINLSHF